MGRLLAQGLAVLVFGLAGWATLSFRAPVVQVAAAPRGDVVAVIYSGDGGWTGLDQAMARALAERGAGVVGVDSLRYFWRPKTADAAAADLAEVIARWPGRKVVLAGYSFGADALPAIVAHLSAQARGRVDRLMLIAPEPLGELAFHPGAWWGAHPPDSYPIRPVVARLAPLSVICLYGRTEHGDACPNLPRGVRKIALPGGHHFGGDGRAVGLALARAAGL